MVELADIKDLNRDISEYKGKDISELAKHDELGWFYFAKANKGFREPGVSYQELYALYRGLMTKKQPLNILETGQCFGTTTRFLLCYVMKYGGNLYSCECKIRPLFKESMEELGLWDKFTTLEGNSMTFPLDPNFTIDYLFIDSEHALEDALGEYMRYRAYLKGEAIVGFHDTECCPGVAAAIEIANMVDVLEPISIVENKASAGCRVYARTGKRTGNFLMAQKNKETMFGMLKEVTGVR